MARDLTREYVKSGSCEAPAHVLFPQLVRIVQKYVEEKVTPITPAERLDLFLSPYYGWAIERLVGSVRPDTLQGEAPEVPRYETSRGPGSSADVDYWTSKDVREVAHDYIPDFIVRLKSDPHTHLIVETKGFDDLAEVKTAAAQRWVAAVNADGRMGTWHYSIARKVEDVRRALDGYRTPTEA
jgi:type III restriction enzyme